MILLAVSGGPDSMYLLNDYKKRRNIVVAHVNYKKRKDSDVDQKIVEDFCKKYEIKLETFIVKDKCKGNFQKWAREIRYNFFKKLYEKYECNQLVMAHHKDDFIETALMQQRSDRSPNYFGIKKKNIIDGMNIFRPYVDSFWKADLIEMNEKDKVPYALDYTNDEPTYTRNKIRLELKDSNYKNKQSIYKWFIMSNKILKKKNKRIKYEFLKWKDNGFDLEFFTQSKNKNKLVFEFIYKDNLDIKLSTNKIKNIISFLEHNTQSKIYKLNDKYIIKKIDKKILITTMV